MKNGARTFEKEHLMDILQPGISVAKNLKKRLGIDPEADLVKWLNEYVG